MGLGRSQVESGIDQNILDALERQNTAAVVRAVLKMIAQNYFNLKDDQLTVEQIEGLEEALANAGGGKFDEYVTSLTVGNLFANTDLEGKTAVEALKIMLTRPFSPAALTFNVPNFIEKGADTLIAVSGGINLNDEPPEGVTNRRIEKVGVAGNWQEPAGNNFNYNDTIRIQTTYHFRADVTNETLPDSTLLASRTVSAFAPSYYGEYDGSVINEADTKLLRKKEIWGAQGSRAIQFVNNNQRVVFAEPKSNGQRLRIMDQNGFNVTAGFITTEASFLLRANDAEEGEPSNEMREDMYIYTKNDPSGNGAAFVFTFYNS